MSPILLLDKPVGVTPLSCIKAFVEKHPEYEGDRLGYAGRLDPMAEGLLVVLVGDENKNREAYLGLDKEYEVEVLFGIGTDTYDVLGKIEHASGVHIDRESIDRALEHYRGEIEQSYPPYSSKTVHGKPLYAWAREGRLHEIEIPTSRRHIYAIRVSSMRTLSCEELESLVMARLDSLEGGDFRVDEIRALWQRFFNTEPNRSFDVLSLVVVCSSGTYMRSLAHEIGTAVGTHALALSIKRTRVGPHHLSSAVR